jgi:2-amino-4-hydroxy-6-hydroxymethyldihydropteridine diphosphokinase
VATARAFVGLGANLGPARETLERALADLDALPGTRCVARSSFYRSEPVEAAGPDFFNAVAELRSPLSPQALLKGLQAIEAQHGRERPYFHAPRTLDLDLLLMGDQIIDEAGLRLPHPRLHLRAFVLLPLLELDPALVHPQHGPLQRWRAAVADQRILRCP